MQRFGRLSPRLDFQLLNNQLVLSWTNAGFNLQSAPAVTGPFTNLPAATSPYAHPLTAPSGWRLLNRKKFTEAFMNCAFRCHKAFREGNEGKGALGQSRHAVSGSFRVFDADIGTQGLGVVDRWTIASLTITPRAGSIDVMNSCDAWAREVKKRLERTGYSVSVPGPALAMKKKRAGRLQDLRLLARGKASPEEIQNKNSLFRGRAKRFRIVDYGGLDDHR